MAEPYLLNRFFETPLLIASSIDPHGSLGHLNERIATGTEVDLEAEATSMLAECAIELADRFTRDIGQSEGGRYRWEWDAQVERGELSLRAGPFWSCLFPFAQGTQEVGIRLEDPRLPWIGMEEPSLRFREGPSSAPWQHHHIVRLKLGQVAMFPAWLAHQITHCDWALRIDLWALLGADRARTKS